MESFINFLKDFAAATGAGSARYTMTFKDGSTVTIIFKPNKIK